MAGYLLDTNILIAWFGELPGYQVLETILAEPETELFTSVVCVAEFLAGCSVEDAEVLAHIIESGEIGVVPFAGLKEAARAAEFRRSLGLKMPDAIIACACSVRNLALVTLDEELRRKVNGKLRAR